MTIQLQDETRSSFPARFVSVLLVLGGLLVFAAFLGLYAGCFYKMFMVGWTEVVR